MISIIDYGMGNLRSVEKAFARLGHRAEIVSRPEEVKNASRIVLPGVGAFADAIESLRRQNLVEPIGEFVQTGKPFLGVCLGLQLLFEKSYEVGEHTGLGLIPGDVIRFDVPKPLKIPHMGWNSLQWKRRPPAFKTLPDNCMVYFVHSYFVRPTDPQVVAAETEYGRRFASIVWKDNIVACQFHPEKSQAVGLSMLDGFAKS